MALSVFEWLGERRRSHGLDVKPALLSRCSHWHLAQGEMRHETGRFFQVVGARAALAGGSVWEAPLMRQEEVGLLAFLVRASGGAYEWLLQAKAEPGNVGGAQIAPTIQATESNFERVHGGAATRYLEWFVSGDEHVIADVHGSEIGTRFLRKRNRNAVARVPSGRDVALGGAWRWWPGGQLRELLRRDYVVGTEARSVVVSAPWALIADGTPFARWRDGRGFRARLAASYASDPDASRALAELERARAAAPAGAHEIPIEELADWLVDDRGIRPRRKGDVGVRLVSVVAHDREVRRWCQPLMARPGLPATDLVCQVRDGVLRFALRATWEPGLAARVELAPSRSAADGGNPARQQGERTWMSLRQSDEGGRFWRCRTRYRIVERAADARGVAAPGELWLTLAQLETLAHQPMTLTIETRICLSLLLSLA